MIDPALRQIKTILTSRSFIFVLVSSLAVSMTLTYAILEPRPREEFLTINTLGADMTAGNYYPEGRILIDENDQMSWYVRVHNNMESSEYLAVRIKLLNATNIAPDTQLHNPSPESYFYEERSLVAKGSIWTFPIVWSITDIERSENFVTVKAININGVDVGGLNISNVENDNFRIILELWKYDPTSEEFVFDWSASDTQSKSAWNQIWLKIQ
jgi:hypothetical protein